MFFNFILLYFIYLCHIPYHCYIIHIGLCALFVRTPLKVKDQRLIFFIKVWRLLVFQCICWYSNAAYRFSNAVYWFSNAVCWVFYPICCCCDAVCCWPCCIEYGHASYLLRIMFIYFWASLHCGFFMYIYQFCGYFLLWFNFLHYLGLVFFYETSACFLRKTKFFFFTFWGFQIFQLPWP